MDSLKKPIEYVEVSVGPVIGKVTSTTARILIEFKEVDQYQTQTQYWLKTEDENPYLLDPYQVKYVRCTLFEENGSLYKEEFQERLPLKVNIPMVFSFENLKPGTRYSVQLNCSLPVGKSSFYTLGRKAKGVLHVGITSCNEISIHEGKNLKKPDLTNDLWADLDRSIESHELDYIFHIGDQVYMDMEGDNKKKHIYDQCCDILRATGGGIVSQEVVDQILEILRRQYRRTWTNPSTAKVLANIPNLMICDDHEVRDDWGYRNEDFLPKTLDYFYGQLARQVYYEYQRQLRENIPWEGLKSLKPEHHHLILKPEYFHEILNGVGVSFVEYRGCRSWFREEKLQETRIGDAQKTWITSLYADGGEFDRENVKSAMFISPLPLFLLAHFLNKLAYLKSDDIQEHWTYDSGSVSSLSKLLDLLRGWKKRFFGRELLIVGGDCHLGGWTEIQYQREPIFRQFVTSAINNVPASAIEKGVMDVLMNFGKLNNDYTFIHHNWRRENNYGIVKVDPFNEVSPIESSLVWYLEERQQMVIHTAKPII